MATISAAALVQLLPGKAKRPGITADPKAASLRALGCAGRARDKTQDDACPRGEAYRYLTKGRQLARAIESWFICDGRYRIHSINPVGRYPARIIEIEDVDTRERFYGSGEELERMAFSLVRTVVRPQLQKPEP